MKPSSQNGRVVIVTGASAGIGRAIAHRFARAGDRIGLIARDESALGDVRGEIEVLGVQAEFEAVDVSDADALLAAAGRLEQRLGAIDIWINDAMETVFSRVVDITPQEYRRVTEVTYLGFVYGTMAALRSMRSRDSGCIVQIGSALAYRGIPLQAAYCGAKHAIRGFTDSLRTELIAENSNIRLTAIDLPAVNTPQFDWARAHVEHAPRPMGTPIEPEVVADAVFRAAAGTSREYWLGGATALSILANAVAPKFLDYYLARNAISGQQTRRRVAPNRRDNLDAPVTDLHRTRGRFSAESANSAALVSGQLARAGVVVAGGALLFGLGALATRSRRRR